MLQVLVRNPTTDIQPDVIDALFDPISTVRMAYSLDYHTDLLFLKMKLRASRRWFTDLARDWPWH